MAKKKQRPPIYLQYTCKDGSRTVATTASIGLMYWYGRILPHKPIENPEPFGIYVSPSAVPGPYSPMFLSLVVAGLERTFGKAPPVPPHLLEPEHAEKLGVDTDFKSIEKHLKKGTPGIVEYEKACLDILYWLKDEGEITQLLINEPMQPMTW